MLTNASKIVSESALNAGCRPLAVALPVIQVVTRAPLTMQALHITATYRPPGALEAAARRAAAHSLPHAAQQAAQRAIERDDFEQL